MHTLCVIKGDGVGPEVVTETLLLLQAIHWEFNIREAQAGYQCYLDNGTPLPDDTVKKCRESDAILFGAVTTPPNIANYFSPIVRLRKLLNLYANVRPFYSLPLELSRQNIDFIIIRENTEDLYAGIERETEIGAEATRVITKKASERIIRFAFKLAVKQRRGKVTVVHKANILRLTDGLFLNIAEKVHGEFTEIEMDDMLVDSCALNLVKKPHIFDIIVTTNMFGDILSDEAASLVGGLGVVASTNIGKNHSLFEPVHGSAPKHCGKNVINPVAIFFAACFMLEHLGEHTKAFNLKQSIIQTMKNGVNTFDLGGTASTKEVTREVIKNYREIYDHS